MGGESWQNIDDDPCRSLGASLHDGRRDPRHARGFYLRRGRCKGETDPGQTRELIKATVGPPSMIGPIPRIARRSWIVVTRERSLSWENSGGCPSAALGN